MNKEEFNKQFRLQDRVVRVFDKKGRFRVSAIKNSLAARTAQERHGTTIIPSYLLARQLSAASLLASFLKGEERIITEAEGDGPAKKIFAEAVQAGEIRGFAEYDESIDGLDIKDISQALGKGVYKVSRVLYGKNEPATGIVELKRGDIASDLANYLSQSEQIPSAVVLDVEFDDEGLIKNSGGILLQAMPEAKDKEISEVCDSLAKALRFNEYLEKGYMPAEILKDILPFDFDLVKSSRVDFFCRCSKENFLKGLSAFSFDEISDMRDKGDNEMICRYCNEKYLLDEKDFFALKEAAKAREN